jgi:nucleotide-binding universal stress UspA family protein
LLKKQITFASVYRINESVRFIPAKPETGTTRKSGEWRVFRTASFNKNGFAMKNFIIPIDFSLDSLNGLKMALLFSQKTKINIQMINVLPKITESDKSEWEAEHNKTEEKFTALLEEFRPQLKNDSTLEYVIAHGRIYQEVVTLAEKFPDSVIAASTHGASGFQELFIGSNTFRIISSTETPVITLRKLGCPETIRRIVMPIDLSVDSRQKVPFTTEMAHLLQAEVHVVGIHTMRGLINKRKIRSYISQVSGYVQMKAPCETNEVFGDNAAELITNYAGSVKADLISITTERPSGLNLLIGNTVHNILNRSEVPVLCLTPKSIRKSGTFATTGG